MSVITVWLTMMATSSLPDPMAARLAFGWKEVIAIACTSAALYACFEVCRFFVPGLFGCFHALIIFPCSFFAYFAGLEVGLKIGWGWSFNLIGPLAMIAGTGIGVMLLRCIGKLAALFDKENRP
jgi:hypothetical protein